MALTVTNLINALAVAAATPAPVSDATVQALTAGSASLTLFGKVSSVGKQAASNQIVLWYAVLPYNGTDGIAAQTAKVAQRLELKWSELPTQKVVSATPSIPARAGYLHYWLEVPSLPFGATVTIDLVESPVSLVDNHSQVG